MMGTGGFEAVVDCANDYTQAMQDLQNQLKRVRLPEENDSLFYCACCRACAARSGIEIESRDG